MDEAELIEVAEDHPLRVSDRYGPGARWLRRWSLAADGMPVCVDDALDTATATTEEMEAVQEANAAVRAALGVPEPPPYVEPVPASVSRFQARAALHMANLLTSVEAAIAASDNVVAQLAWADAVAFERTSPTITAMAGALGLTEAQVDDLFRTAAGIVA